MTPDGVPQELDAPASPMPPRDTDEITPYIDMDAVAPLAEKMAGLLMECGLDDWDSYGAQGLSPAAARAFSEALAARLFPTVRGGLMLEWDFTDHGPAGRSALMVEFAPDGSTAEWYASNGTTEVEWEASDSGSTDPEAKP